MANKHTPVFMAQMHVVLENIGKGGEEKYADRVVKSIKKSYGVKPLSTVAMTDGCYLIYYVNMGQLHKLHKYFRKKKHTKTIRVNGELTRV